MKHLYDTMFHVDIEALLLSQRSLITIRAGTVDLMVTAAPVLVKVIVNCEGALVTEAAASSRTERRDTVALDSLLLVAEHT